MTTVSKAEFAHLQGVSRARVSQWIAEGAIRGEALSGQGRAAQIVVEAAQAQLRGRLDPARVKAASPAVKPEALSDIALNTAIAAGVQSEFEAGFVAGLVMATYGIGALAATTAMEAGASIETARALQPLMTVSFAIRSEELMRTLPCFRDHPPEDELPIGYRVEALAGVDWAALAQEGSAP